MEDQPEPVHGSMPSVVQIEIATVEGKPGSLDESISAGPDERISGGPEEDQASSPDPSQLRYARSCAGTFLDTDVQKEFKESHSRQNLGLGLKCLFTFMCFSFGFRACFIFPLIISQLDGRYLQEFIWTGSVPYEPLCSHTLSSGVGGTLITLVAGITTMVLIRSPTLAVMQCMTQVLSLLLVLAALWNSACLLWVDSPFWTDSAMETDGHVSWSKYPVDAVLKMELKEYIGLEVGLPERVSMPFS